MCKLGTAKCIICGGDVFKYSGFLRATERLSNGKCEEVKIKAGFCIECSKNLDTSQPKCYGHYKYDAHGIYPSISK
ncbi:hypothetical protein [Clostridium tertium]|uniref:hypothetical protein n=1 Tax=Clostridium tertium TaxID=1559 RepID=UPI0023B2CC6C|nr:hypothetical protein [Clostridium tertium]